MISVEERERIRRAYYLEHKSIRQVAREQGLLLRKVTTSKRSLRSSPQAERYSCCTGRGTSRKLRRRPTCAGYLEYPFKKSTRDTDSIALVRSISCGRREAFVLHFM